MVTCARAIQLVFVTSQTPVPRPVRTRGPRYDVRGRLVRTHTNDETPDVANVGRLWGIAGATGGITCTGCDSPLVSTPAGRIGWLVWRRESGAI